MFMEIELKLKPAQIPGTGIADEGVFQRIQQDEFFGNCRRIPSAFAGTTYWDTADYRLSRNGFTCRTRRTQTGIEATVKARADSDAGLAIRREWNVPVETERFLATAFIGTPVGEPLEEIIADEDLHRLFRTDFTRTVYLYRSFGFQAEIAFDRGSVIADTAVQPILEVEMELKRGSVVALLELGRFFACRYPLLFETRSKFQRGVDLAEIDLSDSEGPEPDYSGESLSAGARRRMLTRMAEIIENLQTFIDLPDAMEHTHRLRVSVRRLRALISFVKPYVAPEGYAKVQGQLRTLAGRFGKMRELDVLAAGYRRSRTEKDSALQEPSPLLSLLADLRKNQMRTVHSHCAGGGDTADLLEVYAWILEPGWVFDGKEPSYRKYLQRKTRRWGQRIDRDLSKLNLGNLDLVHSLRLAVKKMRYALREESVLDEAQTRQLSALEILQQELGEICDNHVEMDFLRDLSRKAARDPAQRDRPAYDALQREIAFLTGQRQGAMERAQRSRLSISSL